MKNERLHIRIDRAERERWTEAARRVGLTLSAWVRMVAMAASAKRPK